MSRQALYLLLAVALVLVILWLIGVRFDVNMT